jgi:UMF1 family MFS transporter
MQPTLFGLTQSDSDSGFTARISFLTVGIWWALFAQIPFYYLDHMKMKKQCLARDLQHFGVESQADFAQKLYNLLPKEGIV